jgi:putative transcriptional regulator
MIEIRIEPMLEKQGKTFYWLAKETGLNHGSIWKFRHGLTKGIQFDVLEKICEALECQPGDILFLTGKKKSSKKKSFVS